MDRSGENVSVYLILKNIPLRKEVKKNLMRN